jgi:hypothetical protein
LLLLLVVARLLLEQRGVQQLGCVLLPCGGQVDEQAQCTGQQVGMGQHLKQMAGAVGMTRLAVTWLARRCLEDRWLPRGRHIKSSQES